MRITLIWKQINTEELNINITLLRKETLNQNCWPSRQINIFFWSMQIRVKEWTLFHSSPQTGFGVTLRKISRWLNLKASPLHISLMTLRRGSEAKGCHDLSLRGNWIWTRLDDGRIQTKWLQFPLTRARAVLACNWMRVSQPFLRFPLHESWVFPLTMTSLFIRKACWLENQKKALGPVLPSL